jgi:hypothetical protein
MKVVAHTIMTAMIGATSLVESIVHLQPRLGLTRVQHIRAVASAPTTSGTGC